MSDSLLEFPTLYTPFLLTFFFYFFLFIVGLAL